MEVVDMVEMEVAGGLLGALRMVNRRHRPMKEAPEEEETQQPGKVVEKSESKQQKMCT
jgi:hypothetical protein